MSNKIFSTQLVEIVEKAVKDEINLEIEAAIKRIQHDIEYNIRKHTAGIVANIFSQFDFVMNENNFIVRVNFNSNDKKES